MPAAMAANGKSKFLMEIAPRDEYVEDLTPYPGVPGAVFTTGQGAQQKKGTEFELGATNGHAALKSKDVVCVDASTEASSGHPARTVGIWVTAVMLVAEMAGSGVLALPRALANTGWLGIALIIAIGVGVGFAGSRLGVCWVMLEQRFPQYRIACRTPYASIGYHAMGHPGKMAVLISQYVTLIGVTTVFLILAGDLLQALLGSIVPEVFGSHCYCTLMVGAVLIPLSWLGTPKDFWMSAVVAMVTTVIAAVVVIVKLLLDSSSYTETGGSNASFQSFFLGFGTILFSFGGASTFPTIQNDMSDRSKFPYSVGIAFVALLLLYVPISTVGYGVVGSTVPSNVLRAVSGPAVQVTQALVVVHLLTAYVILVNPVSQGLEEALSLPRKFSWQRCVLRTLLVLFEIVIGLAIPDFGKILDLVGASTVAIMSFILPPICYLRLSDEPDDNGNAIRPVPFYERLILYLVLLLGLMGGIIATGSAVANISTFSAEGPASCFF